MIKEFNYYRKLLQRISLGQPLQIDRINLVGGRGSSKTWSTVEFTIMACLLKKTKIDAYRFWKGKDTKKLFDQYIEVMLTHPGLLEKLKINLTNKTFKFPNGSIIEITGLHKQGSGQIGGLGTASTTAFDYHITVFEERWEIPDSEFSEVLQGTRGCKNTINIHTSNPWLLANEYIRYCADNYPFDREALIDKFKQFTVLDKPITLLDGTIAPYKEVFHYTNYGVNPRLELKDKIDFEISAEMAPHQADTILYGLPGTPTGGVWQWLLPQMKQPNIKYLEHFVGCVDYGEKHDATAAYIVGFDNGITLANVEHEYYWANKTGKVNKNTNILAKEVVDHFIKFIKDEDLHGTLEVWVDGSAIPFITALNTYAQTTRYASMLYFRQQTDKKRVVDRVETMKTLASLDMIKVDENCKELLRELNGQLYNPDRDYNTARDYFTGDDHAIDAMYYGIAVYWVELLESQERKIQEKIREEMLIRQQERGDQ